LVVVLGLASSLSEQEGMISNVENNVITAITWRRVFTNKFFIVFLFLFSLILEPD
jgi:hypothetical protein